MISNEIIHVLEICFLTYFVGVNGGYLLLNLSALLAISQYMDRAEAAGLPSIYAGFELPISILVPAYNEELTIAASVQALLQLSYREYEVIIINDGSKDDTLKVLIENFSFIPLPEVCWKRIQTKPVKQAYRSTIYPNLHLIDKENGGKADALNVGINASQYPLFCSIDADSVLQTDALAQVVKPFMEDADTVACGGTVRIANGCNIDEGFLTSIGLPRNLLALFQIVEYLRAFLFGRMGWSPLNAMLIISGAFGLFRKDVVVDVGGYRTDTVGEDMELVVRIHRMLREQKKRYRITYVPDPVCWTEAPEDISFLKSQRIRWQRGLSESLTMNFSLLFNRRGGAVGWLAFPFMVVFEWLGPIIEVAGYVLMALLFWFGYVSTETMLMFIFAAIGLGVLLSVTALLLEEMSFHTYPKIRQIIILLFAAIVENFGFRQFITVCRLIGLIRWAFGSKGGWGRMERKASWNQKS